MARTTKPKTILDHFRSGVEIDAAVRRAVRKAVGVRPLKRKSVSKTGKSRSRRAA
jgi:hypothetical protein